MVSLIISLAFVFSCFLQSNQNDIQANYNKQNIFKQGFCANPKMLSSPINIQPPFTYLSNFNILFINSKSFKQNSIFMELTRVNS